MTRRRRLIHSLFLFLLPLVVAGFGFGLLTAAILVAAMLLWRWLIVLSGIRAPEQGPALVLETIQASHFVEKVRWAMDRLGVDYAEHATAGTLGVFFTGRTVPQLRIRTGVVESVIGNSPEILRYLWGAYATEFGERAAFLEPTAERLEFERRLDRYGANLQVWVYHHLLGDRELTVHAWGGDSEGVPGWQRTILRALFPLLAVLIRNAFRIDNEHYARSVSRIEELLGQVETRLADGRQSVLGGNEINYTDLAFAAFSGLWLQPDDYGAGRADACRLERARMPAPMREDVARWSEDFPKATAWVEALYGEHRHADTGGEDEQ